MARWTVLLTLGFFVLSCWSSRIKIERNGYKNILVTLPRNVEQEDRAAVVRNVEQIFIQSTERLLLATKGRAVFSEVTILIPYDWEIPEGDTSWRETTFNSSCFPESGVTWTESDADVVITSQGEYPYVLHQAGCGLQGLRIYIPKDALFSIRKKFLRLWSEYRYGVFPEGGFRQDERYPFTYTMPGEAGEKLTQCLNTTKWFPNVCSEGSMECSGEVMASSLMDQHQPSTTQLFCEGEVSLGPKHNPEPPSKHNLLCREEGTWFTVIRSPDFFRGKNAPPKRPLNPSVSFHYVRQTVSPHVIVALEVSSRMQLQSRYLLTKAAFSRFVANVLPDNSKLTLIVFGGDEDPTVLVNGTLLSNEESKISFLENDLLPEDTQDSVNVSLDLLMDKIFQNIENTEVDGMISPDIIIVTTFSHIPETEGVRLREKLSKTGSRLTLLLFGENYESEVSWTSLYDVCNQTHGQIIWLESDPFGNLNRGFGNYLHGPKKEILIMQDYLAEDDDTDMSVTFVVDENFSGSVKVQLSFPYSRANPLLYPRTHLRTPRGQLLTFRKKELLSAWVADVINPEVGEYVIITRRVEDAADPVLITVTSKRTLSGDSITVKIWTEPLLNSQIVPRPIQIFAEIRKGWHPVKGAKVIATVHHPNNLESELPLLDDGLGNSDITKADGIYGRYFTNFTSQGYYNVYVKVFQEGVTAEYLEEPNDFCCGSTVLAISHPTGRFQREVGPATFHVQDLMEDQKDHFPPARVTDLKLNSTYDRIFIIQWTAVGNDYDSGFAERYELKVFPDRALIRTSFSNSGQEIFREIIKITSDEATYGVMLNHIFQLPETIQKGIYYLAIRAVDASGNTGEPSNAVPLWIEGTARQDKQCNTEQSLQNLESTFAEKLQDKGNSAQRLIPNTAMCMYILVNIVVMIIS